MTHGEIIQLGTCTTDQCCTGIDQATQLCLPSSEGLGRPLWDLQTSGLSVCARSRSRWEAGGGSGSKGRLYSQAVHGPDSSTSSICKVNRAEFERDRYPGPGGFCLQGSQAWSSKAKALGRFVWSIALIGCRATRLPKPTSFWFPRRSGRRQVQING